jgi:hypothetical protein
VATFGGVRAAERPLLGARGAWAVWDVLMEIWWVEGVYSVGEPNKITSDAVIRTPSL